MVASHGQTYPISTLWH